MVSSLCNFRTTWLAFKNEYKGLMMEYNIDKHLNEISGHDKHKCSCYNQMDM